MTGEETPDGGLIGGEKVINRRLELRGHASDGLKRISCCCGQDTLERKFVACMVVLDPSRRNVENNLPGSVGWVPDGALQLSKHEGIMEWPQLGNCSKNGLMSFSFTS
jgi:hypothetical protein